MGHTLGVQPSARKVTRVSHTGLANPTMCLRKEMDMKSLTKLAVLFTISLVSTSVNGGVVTWDGGAGTMNWSDANNWNPNGLPGVTSDVVIDVAGTPTINYAGITTTINSIVCNENLSCASGQLIVNATSDMNGNITLNGGTLNHGVWDVAGASSAPPMQITASSTQRSTAISPSA